MKKTIIPVFLVSLAIMMQQPTELVALDTYKAPEPIKEEVKIIKPIPKVQVVKKITGNEEYVTELVEIYSKKYNVSKSELMRTIRNENDTFTCDRQSGLKYKAGNRWGFPAGTTEKSYGVAQIHLPDHPTVTIEQAKSCDFSVEFMASEFSKGKQRQWMGYSK